MGPFRALATALVAALTGTVAFAETEAPAISYLGFNKFVAGEDRDPRDIFTAYIDTVTPIMARHGLTLDAARVTHQSATAIPADAVTFGTAPDHESFQAFFADPEYQAAFPQLVGIIEAHTVVFLSAPLTAPQDGRAPRMLTTDWIGGDLAEGVAALEALEEPLADLRARFGVVLDGEANGVAANQGLTDDVEAVAPPHRVRLRRMRHAHGYLEHPDVLAAHEAAKDLLERRGAYWLEPWGASRD